DKNNINFPRLSCRLRGNGDQIADVGLRVSPVMRRTIMPQPESITAFVIHWGNTATPGATEFVQEFFRRRPAPGHDFDKRFEINCLVPTLPIQSIAALETALGHGEQLA